MRTYQKHWTVNKLNQELTSEFISKNNLNAKRLPTAAFSYSDGSPKITKPAQKIGKSIRI